MKRELVACIVLQRVYAWSIDVESLPVFGPRCLRSNGLYGRVSIGRSDIETIYIDSHRHQESHHSRYVAPETARGVYARVYATAYRVRAARMFETPGRRGTAPVFVHRVHRVHDAPCSYQDQDKQISRPGYQGS